MSESWPDNWPLDAIATIEEGEEEIERLQHRIEELEDECAQLKQGYTAIRNDMGKVARAAKARIEELEKIWGKWRGWQKRTSRSWRKTPGIKIVRCEGCGGSGEEEYPGYQNNERCPDCDGHGWVVKSE